MEKTLEQCSLGYLNSQRAERVFNGTKTQVMARMINKWEAKIIKREIYNVRDS